MFTAMFSAASIVWDREFGFLREMMVAPVRRSSIVIGKCLGGATVASFQGVILIAPRRAVDVPYDPRAGPRRSSRCSCCSRSAITAFGVMVAVRIKQMQSFMGVMQMIVMPMFFISGALFPVASLPGWLAFLNRIDPLTYAVDPMRRLVFNHLDISRAARAALDPGVTWWGWHVPGAARGRRWSLLLGLVMLGDRDLGVQRERVTGAARRRMRDPAGGMSTRRTQGAVAEAAPLEAGARRPPARAAAGSADPLVGELRRAGLLPLLVLHFARRRAVATATSSWSASPRLTRRRCSPSTRTRCTRCCARSRPRAGRGRVGAPRAPLAALLPAHRRRARPSARGCAGEWARGWTRIAAAWIAPRRELRLG